MKIYLVLLAIVSSVLPGVCNGQQLKPGIYVVARDLEGATVVGTHQFIVMVPQDASKFKDCRDLGKNTHGLVVSTIKTRVKTEDRLMVERFDSGDLAAIKEYTTKSTKWYKADLDPEVARVDTGKTDIDEAISILQKSIEHYVAAEEKKNIEYPDNIESASNGDHLLNSNSWAQSLIEYSFGKKKVTEDFAGADFGHKNRIDRAYFK